jgi:glycosyltransferase involved in cell wall biosynthesis
MTSAEVKVLHIITRLIVGGAQENTMYTAALLDKERFDVAVVSGLQTGSEGSLIEMVRDFGIHLEILPELVREINTWKDLVALIKLYIKMRSGDFKIIHTHSSKAGLLGRLAGKLAGVPIIVHTVHGWSFHEWMSPVRRRLYIALERLTARWSDALIVVAEKDITKGLDNGIGVSEQYQLIRSAIPLDDFNPKDVSRIKIRQELGIEPGIPVLGNVGRLSPQKNPIDWVRVAEVVVKAVPECNFLLVGDGPLRHQVESLISETGLANRTILTGIRRDVPRLLAAMDVFLLTSLWEGLPRVIPQAMAMGVPVVANYADGTSEVIDHGVTGYLCEPGRVLEMAEHCIELLKDPKLKKQMGIKGQETVQKEFDLRVMVNQIEHLYEKMLTEKKIPS